jgi:hypothetical protein
MERNGYGRQIQTVLRDPSRDALNALRNTPGISEMEESPLGLEEIYTVLFAGARGAARVLAHREGDQP